MAKQIWWCKGILRGIIALFLQYKSVVFWTFYAWMVELVDTTDLKSVDPKGRAGSSPAPGTKREIAAMQSPVFWFL